LIMLVVLSFPSWVGVTIMIIVIIGWGIAGGYKEWSVNKERKKNENPGTGN